VFFRTQNLSLGTFPFFFGLRGFGCLCFFVAGGFSFFLSFFPTGVGKHPSLTRYVYYYSDCCHCNKNSAASLF